LSIDEGRTRLRKVRGPNNGGGQTERRTQNFKESSLPRREGGRKDGTAAA